MKLRGAIGRVAALFILYFVAGSSCRVDPFIIDLENSGYPKEIGRIMLNKCSTPGCHTAQSKEAAAGLSLESWDSMFEGTRNGATVIPYSHEQSTLFLFTNTYPELGVSVKPTMPYNGAPLTKEEIELIRNWIAAGAPDAKGFVKFSDNPLRSKIYITNQGCDLVTVVDAKTKLPMRYVQVGKTGGIESPHYIRVSPDGQFWYVLFTGGTYFQKYRCSDDTFVDDCEIGTGNWNTFVLSGDGKGAFVVDWSSNGKVFYIDTQKMIVKKKYQGTGLFSFPHGAAISPNDSVLYVTGQTGNFVYKIDVGNPLDPEVDRFTADETGIPSGLSKLDIHEAIFSPEGDKLFLTCQKTNEVRVIDPKTDKLIGIIPTGIYPQEMAISPSKGLLFVTCPEDSVTFPGNKGCVTIIDYRSMTKIKNLYTGFQPHGIGVDDSGGRVYVAHRNVYSSGPAPHHTTSCGGRNGYFSLIDLNTLDLVPNQKTEVSVDPYSVAFRK